jgi:hypothetical protein
MSTNVCQLINQSTKTFKTFECCLDNFGITASAVAGLSAGWAVAAGSGGGAKEGDVRVMTGEGGGRTAGAAPEGVPRRSVVG